MWVRREGVREPLRVHEGAAVRHQLTQGDQELSKKPLRPCVSDRGLISQMLAFKHLTSALTIFNFLKYFSAFIVPKLKFFLIIHLPSELLPVLGPTERGCASTLGATLLCSYRAGSDLGFISR